MSPVWKIALGQMHVIPLDLQANHTKAISLINRASQQGADLVVLPEYHLTGWAPSDPAFSDLCASFHAPLEAYRALAQSLSINIVPGTLVEKHVLDEQDVFYNTSYFISSTGTILASYTKKNLWHPERDYLTSSSHDPHAAFDTPLGRVGLLTCWDLAFPEAFRELVADGAKIIVIPSFWTLADCGPEARKLNPNAEGMFLDSVLMARACENTAAVVFVNAGGPVGAPGDWAGLSQVAVPIMGKLGGLGAEEGLEVVDLDMQVLELAEGVYKVREDMGREEWHYGYSLRKNNGVSGEGREK